MKAKQLHLGLLGLLGLIAFLIFGGWWWAQGQLGSRVSQLQKLNADAILANQQVENLHKLQADYDSLASLTAQVQSVLPPQKEQADVIAQISQLAADNGVELSGLTFDSTQGLPSDKSQSQPASIGGIFVMPVHFSTTSSYQNLANLLKNFENQE